MKRIFKYIVSFIIFSGIWMVLNEKISPVNFITGGLLGLFCILITNILQKGGDYVSAYTFNIYKLIIYCIVMIKNIYIAGFKLVIRIIKGDINPVMVTVFTDIKKELYSNIIANSITLTPGTVTLYKRGDRIKVLTYKDKKNPELESLIKFKENLEKIFK
jgi:multicomponent Na+:H+ antiporter subunit E